MRHVLVVLIGLSTLAAMAQQSSSSPNPVLIPGVQLGADRPGGISFVTRRTGTVGNVLAANALWAAGGVNVLSGVGAGGIPPTTSALVASKSESTQPRLNSAALADLRLLAARGDLAAKKVLAETTAVRR